MPEKQRSHDWFAARCGKVTGSRVKDVMAKTKSGYGASRANYMSELVVQRLTGRIEESFQSAAMRRGTETEPLARFAYEMETGRGVEEVSFIPSPDIEAFGASPDGLVGKDGLIEIKCPQHANHIDFLLTGKIDVGYQWQMLAQMHVTGRKWCDFVSYDPDMPEELQIKIVRFKLDSAMMKEMLEEITKFLTELSTMEGNLRRLINGKGN